MKLYNPFKNWYNPFKPHIVRGLDNMYVLRVLHISALGWQWFDFVDQKWWYSIYSGALCKTETELRVKYATIKEKPEQKVTVIKL